MFAELVPEKILNEKIKFIQESLIVEDYGLPSRINFSDSKKHKPVHHWISYNIISDNLILTKLDLPFDINGELIYSKNKMKEILKPYLKVLERKTNVDLKKAIEIAKENGLTKIYNWSIDYENRKLVWTLRSKLENNMPEVIKINSKNEKILSKTIEISIH
ncbi:hypothetical protein [uncultured Aquimarina sp.]|uniref:hypothetical protein n=1 Tax=uncultured Aquimarina sp. TaxID=575652 RepID=UPI00261348B0|nr:hypothetical protein [uncultured Aquimarina sp.]